MRFVKTLVKRKKEKTRIKTNVTNRRKNAKMTKVRKTKLSVSDPMKIRKKKGIQELKNPKINRVKRKENAIKRRN